ncbi:MAG: hypothetical protein AAB649_05020, partial [Patescibacteria group bacterium]
MVALFLLGILQDVDVVLAFVVSAIALCVVYDRYLDRRYTALQLHILVFCFGFYGVAGGYLILTTLAG